MVCQILWADVTKSAAKIAKCNIEMQGSRGGTYLEGSGFGAAFGDSNFRGHGGHLGGHGEHRWSRSINGSGANG